MKYSNRFPIPKTSRSEDLKFRDKESVKTFHKILYLVYLPLRPLEIVSRT